MVHCVFRAKANSARSGTRVRVIALLVIAAGASACLPGGGGSTSGSAPSTIDPCTDPRSLRFMPVTRFTRETGRPVAETEEFSVPFDGQFCVTVVNGASDPPRGNRISSARIDIDGSPIFDPHDFNQLVDVLDTTIALSEGPHLLNVLLASMPGSFVEVSIRGLPDPGIPFSLAIAPTGTIPINAAIIAVTPDTSFTAAERAYFELYATFMSSGPPGGVDLLGVAQLPFSEATGSRATVNTSIVTP